MNWRASKAYAYIRPYVPNSLRSLARGFQRFVSAGLVSRRAINFGEFRLLVSNRDSGGAAHESMYWHELHNPLTRELAELLRPQLYLDIGANYGFSSLLQFIAYPSCHIIAVEPNPFLIPFIQHNLATVGCSSATVLNCVCSDGSTTNALFSINPTYSQDSRVIGPRSWRRVTVPTVTLDELCTNIDSAQPVLIKVDTQGYERQVLAGGSRFFSRSSSWVMKVEFAPRWLTSQGTDPVHFIEELVDSYVVVELPSRIRYRGDSLADLLRQPLERADCTRFEDFIRSSANDDGGYCDLLVLPRSSPLNRDA